MSKQGPHSEWYIEKRKLFKKVLGHLLFWFKNIANYKSYKQLKITLFYKIWSQILFKLANVVGINIINKFAKFYGEQINILTRNHSKLKNL